MKTVLLCLVITFLYMLAGHFRSGDGLTPAWYLAFLLYCGPLLMLFLSSFVV